MSQKTEREAAIDKARKLLAQKVESGVSEAAADFAMRKAGELMDAFEITLDEISLSEQECKKIELVFDDGNTFRLGTVCVAVANFCDCVTYYSAQRKTPKKDKAGNILYGKSNKWAKARVLYEKAGFINHFYGVTSDAEMAAYLMETVREAAKTAVVEFKKTEQYKTYSGSKVSLTKSFVEGFASRIVSRLNTLKEERDEAMARARAARQEMGESTEQELNAEVAEEQRKRGTSTDLVDLKAKKVESGFKEAFGWSPKYRTTRRFGSSNWTGKSAGAGAADRVNLSRPVGGGGFRGQLQLS